jgi:hypothetical protein
LQEFDRNAIRTSNKRHVSIARWAINRDSEFFEVRTERIDIIDPVCEVAKISTARVSLWIPVVGYFNQWGFGLLRTIQIIWGC